MTAGHIPDAHSAAQRVIKIDEELEASGEAKLEEEHVERARAAMHAWVDRAVAFVATPALGRVTVIHADGRRSSIASADLPFLMSEKVRAS